MSKDSIFINFSNHPSELWEIPQRKAAEVWGTIVDIPFPMVFPLADEKMIAGLGDEYVSRIAERNPAAVMCQGEFTLSYYVIRKLKERGIRVLSACTERISRQEGNEKISVFSFVRFREYV